jgi:hypothetical protein
MTISLDSPSFALINGSLCKLNRRGTVVKRHAPLGGAIMEFHVHSGHIYVREDAGGFLAGMPNLYCLDENLFITWLAELPSALDPYATIVEIGESVLSCRTQSGTQYQLSLIDGRSQQTGLDSSAEPDSSLATR